MGKAPEQISNDILPVPPKAKRTAKRQKARTQRRAGKGDPENAPKKQGYRGWYW